MTLAIVYNQTGLERALVLNHVLESLSLVDASAYTSLITIFNFEWKSEESKTQISTINLQFVNQIKLLYFS